MFKILDEVCVPTKGTEFSACIDLYASEDVVIGVGETVLVGLGVKIDLETPKFKSRLALNYSKQESFDNFKNFRRFFMKSHQLNLHIRSSMSAKHGLIIANGTGIIDFDYSDEIKICLHNPITNICFDGCGNLASKTVGERELSKVFIKRGQPIAQISLVEHKSYLFDTDSAEKRDGGFGSTDKQDGTACQEHKINDKSV